MVSTVDIKPTKVAQNEYDRHIKIKKGASETAVHVSNATVSSSYTAWNFIPKNLGEQMRSTANVYFLVVGIFQLIKPISATGGRPDSLVVLGLTLLISMIRAGIEDLQKHRADDERNKTAYEVFLHGKWESITLGDIKVGQILKVTRGQLVPADLLLLTSSLEKKQIFMDRSNLNGETRLEVMDSISLTKDMDAEKSFSDFSMQLDYEEPNKRFDQFDGQLTIGNEEIHIDGTVLMMRETNLRNCEYAIGLTVYTGLDTKIEMSNRSGEKQRPKISRIDIQMSFFQQIIIVAQFIFCVILALVQSVMSADNDERWYLMATISVPIEFAKGFFGWFQIFSQLVPITLVVVSQLAKTALSLFIQWDMSMEDKENGTRAKVNRATIHEDLGLVGIIFSDKTGTLTRNKMEFRYLQVHVPETENNKKKNIDFGSTETAIYKRVKERQNAGDTIPDRKKVDRYGKKYFINF